LPRRALRILAELEGIYRYVAERIAPYAVSSHITKFAGLEAERSGSVPGVVQTAERRKHF
jgi:hypothetical protein